MIDESMFRSISRKLHTVGVLRYFVGRDWTPYDSGNHLGIRDPASATIRATIPANHVQMSGLQMSGSTRAHMATAMPQTSDIDIRIKPGYCYCNVSPHLSFNHAVH